MAGIILEYFCSVFVFVFYIISSYVTSMNMLQNRHLVNVIDLDFQCSKNDPEELLLKFHPDLGCVFMLSV